MKAILNRWFYWMNFTISLKPFVIALFLLLCTHKYNKIIGYKQKYRQQFMNNFTKNIGFLLSTCNISRDEFARIIGKKRSVIG